MPVREVTRKKQTGNGTKLEVLKIKRKSQSGKLFDKTGDFHDRADND